MSYLQVAVLAIVQGLTEFLPVSSSGHLVILQKILGFAKAPVLFDILVHVGTLGAIFFYFKRDLFEILKNWRKNLNLFKLVIVGTIPVAFVGAFFEEKILSTFDSLRIVGVSLLITASLLFSLKWIKFGKHDFNKLKWQDGLFVGLLQTLALLPGVSRSGSTITAGLWTKASYKTAFRFSFYLAIPAIIGALVLQIPDLTSFSSNYLKQGILGMVMAGVVGFFALRALEKILRSTKLFWFGFYCLALSLFLLLA